MDKQHKKENCTTQKKECVRVRTKYMDWYIKYNMRRTDELRLLKCLRYQNCLKLISKKKPKR